VSEGLLFKSKKYKKIIFIIILLTAYCLLFTVYCFAEEQTTITSDTLEYSKETGTYYAKGNVNIKKNDIRIEADEIQYNEKTSDAIATGSVKYYDPDTSITASRAELNLEKKTGTLYDAEILFKKDNYRIKGKEIDKRSEKYYFSPEATFTTCDAPVPAWCFQGKNINAVTGEEIKADKVSFRIKDIPLLYIPYLRASLLNERQTGFLPPKLGYSNSRGGFIGIPFYWAISENQDATFKLDIYTKKGVGEGFEYRYVEPDNVKGNLWLYHIRDTSLDKDFFEIKASHEQRNAEGIGGFLDINYVNEKDFFREFEYNLEGRTNRFLQSTGEVTLPFTNSRLYLLSQYWVDLEGGSSDPPQRLPEVGFVLNPTKIGSFWVSAETSASNFWRDEGMHGQRLDVYPRISYETGSDVTFLQTLGLRETAYSLQEDQDSSLHRESLEYNILTHTRFIKRYGSFTHILEPSLGYTLITDSEDLPVFDSTELFKKTSTVELSLLNRFINSNGEFMIIKASQGLDTYLGDRPFLPFRLEIGIRRPVSLRLDTSYDVRTGKLESINSDLGMNLYNTMVSIGQRYNRQDDISTYVVGIGLHPFKSLYTEGRIWYDENENRLSDISLKIIYSGQCWGMNMTLVKRPGDFTAAVMFELKGVSKGLKL
jgi:LPS-assembly protein